MGSGQDPPDLGEEPTETSLKASAFAERCSGHPLLTTVGEGYLLMTQANDLCDRGLGRMHSSAHKCPLPHGAPSMLDMAPGAGDTAASMLVAGSLCFYRDTRHLVDKVAWTS